MKLKTLLIVIAVLAAFAAGAYFLNRPDRAAPDQRVGQPLVAPSLVERATRIEISENGQTVRLRESAPGAWLVESYHDLPADFAKLSSLADSLASAKIERLVTQNPDRIARLEFSDTRVAFSDSSGASLSAVTLGKTADGGGRFVKFGDEPKAYLSRVNVWLDATARNWADTSLLKFTNDEIASVTLTFPTGEPLTFTRTDKTTSFTASATPEGRQVNASALTTLLTNLGNLRFTETSAPDAPDAAGARAHARTITLKTFAGKTYTVLLGRQPERTVLKAEALKPDPQLPLTVVKEPAPSPDKAGPAAVAGGQLTEKVPAGPVFAFVSHSDTSAPINALMQKRAFQVGEFVFTGLPSAPDALFEATPVKTPSASGN